MTGPAPQPGWYPDPAGSHAQRYFDGARWTDQVAPSHPNAAVPNAAPYARVARPGGKSRLLLAMAIAGPVVAIIAFIGAQLAFAAGNDGGAAVLFQIVGFAAFVVWIAGVVAFLVGVVGMIVQAARKR